MWWRWWWRCCGKAIIHPDRSVTLGGRRFTPTLGEITNEILPRAAHDPDGHWELLNSSSSALVSFRSTRSDNCRCSSGVRRDHLKPQSSWQMTVPSETRSAVFTRKGG